MSTAAIYSVVNLKRKCQDDVPQGEDVVYTEIKFPDSLCPQNVSRDGKAGKEKPGSHPHPYRLTVVCLLLLCFFLTICIIVLSICLHRANRKCSVMEGDLQQLMSKKRNLTKEKEQIEQNCSFLASDNIQLNKNYSITVKQKDVLQKNYIAVLDKSHHLTSYCDTTEIQHPCRSCPMGWELFNSSCYFISQDQKSWVDSRIECLKLGADLVIIESKEEQDFIKGKKDDYWIGLTYNTNNKHWIWLDGTSPKRFQIETIYHSYPYAQNCAKFISTFTKAPCHWPAKSVCETRALLLKSV